MGILMSVALPFTIKIIKPAIKWPIVGTLLVGVIALSGCLTRQAGPSLPYVRPANSVVQVDQAPIHLAARMQEMEGEIQRLRDQIERLQASGGEEKDIRSLQDRVAFIEKQLGIEPLPQGAGKGASVQQGHPQAQPETRSDNISPDRGVPAPQGVVGRASPVDILSMPLPPDEKAYREAYSAYKNGSFDQSLQLFDEFLVKHPKSEFASSAIYWMGEARFGQGRFDDAVLQFDRVIKEFPGSKKELSCLLRQGQAFEKMGDARSAKIIFQKILSDSPHTAQARIAGSRLRAIPPQ